MGTYEEDRKRGRAMVNAVQPKPKPGTPAAEHEATLTEMQAKRDKALKKHPKGTGGAA